MPKSVADQVLDGAFDVLDTATRMTLCSGAPANFAGIAAVALAAEPLDATDFTKANGDTSGRKCTIAAQTAVAVTASGTATHVALDDGTTLLYVTTCTSTVLTSGTPCDVNAWDVEIADPV